MGRILKSHMDATPNTLWKWLRQTVGRFLKAPTAKAFFWCFGALTAEAVPVGLVWALAVENNTPPVHVVWEYLGGAGPLIIGFGVLVAAVVDIAIEESSIGYIFRNLPELIMLTPGIWWALDGHIIKKQPPGDHAIALVLFVAFVALVVSGLKKRDMWRRHTEQ